MPVRPPRSPEVQYRVVRPARLPAGQTRLAALATVAAVVTVAALAGCKRAPPPPRAGEAAGTPTDPRGPGARAAGPQTRQAAPPPEPVVLPTPTRLTNRVDFERAQVAVRPLPPAPLALTASDGSGLQLRRLAARAVIDGPLAFTELKLVFHNPEPRRREGRFSVTLPAGAAVSRFAMRTGEQWMEGEVVEKQRARRVYEDFLHRKQDPAILEQDKGNVFSARVFPIEAGRDKELVISWSQELADPREAWSLPLLGLPRLGELAIDVFVHKGHAPTAGGASTLGGEAAQMEVIHVARRDFEPHEDLVVWPGFLEAPWDALRRGTHVVARVRPLGAAANDGFERLLVLFDTSASGAPRWSRRLEMLRGLLRFAAVHGAREAVVVAFDQEVETVFEGRPEAFGAAELARIDARAPLGASDLGAALGAAARALSGGGGDARVVLFGDGMATMGERDAVALARRAGRLAEAGVQRLDVVTLATARDDGLLGALTAAALPRRGVVLRLSERDEHPFDRLALRTFAPIRVRVPGATWVQPAVIEGLQAGEQALVFAELAPDKPLRIELSGGAAATLTPRWRQGTGPMIERAAAKARIDGLLLDGGSPEVREARRRQALALSLRHRVLCPLTALLVLETGQDYARYGIDRAALADIMVVTQQGIVGLERRAVPLGLLLGGGLNKDGSTRWPGPIGDIASALRASAGAGGGASIAKKGKGSGGRAKKRPLRADAPRRARPRRASPRPVPPHPPMDRSRVEGAPAKMARAKERPGSLRGRSARSPAVASGPEVSSARRGGSDRDEGEARRRGIRGLPRQPASGAASGGGGAILPRPQRARPMLRMRRLTAGDRRWASAASKALRRYDALLARCLRGPGGGVLHGIWFEVSPTGRVERVQVAGLAGGQAVCLRRRFERLRLPRPPTRQRARALYEAVGLGLPQRIARRPPRRRAPDGRAELKRIEGRIAASSPWRADYGRVRELIAGGHGEEALAAAWRWRKAQIGDVMALVALGDAARARADLALTRRAWGSIIDLFPGRADTRRFAGELLQGLGAEGLRVAIDTFGVATEQRPDHPTGFHLLAMALAAAGRHAEALDAVARGLASHHRGTARAIERVLRDDAADIAAAWAARDPGHRPALERRLRAMGAGWVERPRLRIVLTWETDANDVDLHVFNARADHTWYKRRVMPGGRGEMYRSAFGGYGPEAFVATPPRDGPWRIFACYYRMGPMGWGMGQAQIIRTDGAGGMLVQARPYVLQRDKAWIDLGTVPARMPAAGG